MYRKKSIPISTVIRLCPHCGKVFGPMSDAQWQHVFRLHMMTSLQHNLALYNQVGNSEIH